MKNLIKAVKMLAAKYFGYIIYVPEYNGMHFCFSASECFDWMCQYPADAQMIVVSKRNVVIAAA